MPPAGPDAPRSALERERAALIGAELAALGEDPADEDELAFASVPDAAPDDVRTVATLVELSRWVAPAEGLLPLERHRVWQRIASRVPPASGGGHPVEPAANGGGGHTWAGVLTSLALVASVVMVLRVDVQPPPTAEDRAALAETGESLRLMLEATVPGEQDGARARALADGYAERLAAARGAEP